MPNDVEATSLRDLLCGSVNESHMGERRQRLRLGRQTTRTRRALSVS